MQRQKGFALLSALLLVSFVASLLVLLPKLAEYRLDRAQDEMDLAQARLSILGAADFARWVLLEDQKLDKQKAHRVDSLDEFWAMPVPAVPVERGSVVTRMMDAQSKINLNNIGLRKTGADRAILERLFTQVGIPLDRINALKDWVDADSELSLPGGAEDNDYLNMDLPRRAANQALTDVDELSQVRGFTMEDIERLRPYVTALPLPTPININTAAEGVLAVVFDISPEEARLLVAMRGDHAIQDGADLIEHLPAALKDKWQKSLGTKEGATVQFGLDWDVRSDFFVVLATAHYGRVDLGFSGCIQRLADASMPRLIRLRRTLVTS